MGKIYKFRRQRSGRGQWMSHELPHNGLYIGRAYFTKFEDGTNWCNGKVGNLNFQAKLSDVGSIFGINNGRVSSLVIWDEKIRSKEQNVFAGCVVNYDRGWDIEPSEEIKPYFDAVMELLENAPKRFE